MLIRIWKLARDGAVTLVDDCASNTEALTLLRELNARGVVAIAHSENGAVGATGHVTSASRATIERYLAGARPPTPDLGTAGCPTPKCGGPRAPSTTRLDARLRPLCKRCRQTVWALSAKGASVDEALTRLTWARPWEGLERGDRLTRAAARRAS